MKNGIWLFLRGASDMVITVIIIFVLTFFVSLSLYIAWKDNYSPSEKNIERLKQFEKHGIW